MPDLVDRILEMGHGLAIPSPVFKEIRSTDTLKWVADLVGRGKIVVLDTDLAEIKKMQVEFSGLGSGECGAILACLGGAYCIVDDSRARKRASSMGVKHVGLAGLLLMLRERGIMSREEVVDAIGTLRKTGFYLPRNFERHVTDRSAHDLGFQ